MLRIAAESGSPEAARVGRYVDRLGTQERQRDDLQCTLVGRGEHHRRGRPVLDRLEPAHGDHAPPVPGMQPGEAPLGAGGDQVVAYPLLMGELSYRPGLTCDGGTLCPEWRALILKYPERFLVGSDTWVNQRWSSYDDLMQGYRTWLGGLPADVARAIAWGNGAALFGLR